MSIKDDVLAPATVGSMVIFEPDLRIWSGRIKVRRAEDLQNVDGDLPPKAIFSEGLKPLIDLKRLAPYEAARKRVERFLAKEGVRLPRGKFGIPPEEAIRVAEELDKIGVEFDSHTPDFISELPAYFAEHEEKFLAWQVFLQRGRPDVKDVANAFQFRVAVYRTAPADAANPESILNKRFNPDQEAMPLLLEEISGRADKMLEGPLGKGQSTGVSHANTLRAMVSKMRNFSFIDQRVGPAAKALESMLSGVPSQGTVSLGQAAVIKLVAEILADPNRILSLADVEVETEELVDPRTFALSLSPSPPAPTNAPVDMKAFSF